MEENRAISACFRALREGAALPFFHCMGKEDLL